MRLSEHTYRTLSTIAGPLIFVQNVFSARIGEVVTVHTPDGRDREAEVLEVDRDVALIEVYGGTQGLDIERTFVSFSDVIKRVPLSEDIVGRIFNGSFSPLDGAPMFIPEKWTPITGAPINPAARARPADFIETGFSPIDGLNTLVRGQKLPVFSAAGLPSKEVVAAILKNSRLADPSKRFIVVFAALGPHLPRVLVLPEGARGDADRVRGLREHGGRAGHGAAARAAVRADRRGIPGL